MCKKNFFYLVTLFFSCLLIIVFLNNIPSYSFPLSTNFPLIISQKDSPESSDWRDEILKMEEKSTDNYESFFGRNFSDKSITSEQIASNLKQLQRQTGKNPAALWIWFDKDKLDLTMTTARNKPIGKRINQINEQKLQKVIKELMNEVTNPTPLGIRNSTSYLSSAQQLYQLMIAPFESQLEVEKIDTLIICVNAGLRTLPFAVLHDGQKFLVEKYSIAMVPSFSLTDLSVSQANGKEVEILAMGSSTFDFLSPLPCVLIELNNITPSPWQGVKILEDEFTVNNLKIERQKTPFEIIHLATHAQFQPGDPTDSFIQFNDRKLTLAQLKDLNWHDPPVALLVLSACQTAIGDKQAELGFGGLAVQSGVRSALGSYWSVSDAGTLALMTEFYQHLRFYYNQSNFLLKSDALRDTQIAMIKNQVYVEKGQLRTTRGELTLPSELTEYGDDNLSHPFYWSAFTVIGSPW